MYLSDIQIEINHLLFLYYNNLGLIKENLENDSIKQIEDSIERMFKKISILENSEVNLEYYKEYLKDGFEFLDSNI